MISNASELLVRILGRSESLFQADMEQHRAALSGAIARSRILVIGAAGSIGSAFVQQLLPFAPAAIHLVDPSENNLVELVRTLRSAEESIPEDFRTWAIAMGSREFTHFLAAARPYDAIVNFAALKHVRSERDPFTLMRLIHTNIFALQEMLEQVLPTPPQRVFSVSSDKAVEPENAMGASKAFMEAVLWHYATWIPCSSARFANVAFSDGSLLHGFIRRLEKGQPLSAPIDVRRYFISHQEAGQLCLLACFLGNNRELFVPRLQPQRDLRSFAEIARLFLESQGWQAHLCHSEAEARALARELGNKGERGGWPCYFSESDTSGEKQVESFFSADERVDYSHYQALGVIHNPPFARSSILRETLERLRRVRHSEHWSCQEMITLLQTVVPSLRHARAEKNLDQKM
ncbi:MAG: SDR family NAD(P)-dependent oxidoreductase [Magnetococcales bacterium]|nr:SDR family NAD(P)-dependent oxidoreductase [Magnetococcales bacterium]